MSVVPLTGIVKRAWIPLIVLVVLAVSGLVVSAAVRGSALVARTGGEEFVIVDLTHPGGAEYIAERVRYAIAAPASHPATASIGLSCSARADFVALGSDPTVYLDAIIARADRALFDAKRRGGNATINMSPADDQQ